MPKEQTAMAVVKTINDTTTESELIVVREQQHGKQIQNSQAIEK